MQRHREGDGLESGRTPGQGRESSAGAGGPPARLRVVVNLLEGLLGGEERTERRTCEERSERPTCLLSARQAA